MCENSPGMNQV